MLRALIALPRKSALGWLVRLPLQLIPRRHVTRVRSGLNTGLKWVVGSSTHGCWLGTYEADKQRLVSALVSPGMVVWDVGANAGFYTLAFSMLVGDAGRVYAFEPFAENAHHLLVHVRLNHLRNTTVVQTALAAKPGMAAFQTAPSNSMGRLSDAPTGYLVPKTSIDDFVKQHPESRPQLLKIDVEGAEAEVLKGAAALLASSAPDVLIALHGQDQADGCHHILTLYGYSLYYLDGSAVGDASITRDEIYATKDKRRG